MQRITRFIVGDKLQIQGKLVPTPPLHGAFALLKLKGSRATPTIILGNVRNSGKKGDVKNDTHVKLLFSADKVSVVTRAWALSTRASI